MEKNIVKCEDKILAEDNLNLLPEKNKTIMNKKKTTRDDEQSLESVEEEEREEYLPSDGNVYAAELIGAYKGGDKGAFGALCSIYKKWMKTKNYFYYDRDDGKAEEVTDDQLLIISD